MPSMAPITVTAGVMTLSPKKSVAPNMPMVRISARRRGVRPAALAARAVSAIAPPSPLLSARRIRITYLSVTTSIRPQKIVEIAPIRWWVSSGTPTPETGTKISCKVYSGLVPISP